MSKNILVIQRTAPYGSSLAREGLDFILTSAAYDQNLSVLFMNDGVFQLVKNQDSKDLNLKNQISALEVLPLYDVESLFVVQEDLVERAINTEDLGINVKPIKRSEVANLIKHQHSVIGF